MPLSPTELDGARRALSAALDGSGPPVEFTPSGRVLARPEARDAVRGGAETAAAVVRTSGSTGTPKQTVLTAEALAASAAATADRLSGEGQWLLAVGLQYVAGLAVLSRSIAAGSIPVVMEPGSFTPQAFVTATDRMERGSGFRAVSLVPTQLARLLTPEAGGPAGFHGAAADALRTFDAVLVGGARVPESVRRTAAEAGVRLHLTYGMSETCGGCVYDGVPLDGVVAELVTDEAAAGAAVGNTAPRLRLSGPMVAAGYLDAPELTAAHFGTATPADPAARWYLTEDTGTVQGPPGAQRLTVTGRVDDVINTGGIKVSAQAVQAVLESLPGIRAAFVVGVPDDEWGQRVCAAVVPTDPSAAHWSVWAGQEPFHLPKVTTEHGGGAGRGGRGTSGEREGGAENGPLREAAGRILEQHGAPAVPKQWLVLDQLPLLPNGKTDRQRLFQRFSRP